MAANKNAGFKMHRPRGVLERDAYLIRAKEFAVRGTDLPHTKITPEIVLQIRAAAEKRLDLRQYISENLSNAALAKRYGVHVRTIEKALQFETWTHLL